MSTIDLKTAQKILEGAQAKSSELAANFCICVVDPRGDLITFIREDGAPGRETIEVGSVHPAGVTAQESDPVVEIVNGNEEHVWLSCRFLSLAKRFVQLQHNRNHTKRNDKRKPRTVH